jgi:hypothetical protein
LKALIGFIVLLVGLMAFASTKPNTFIVERALRMRATPDGIFPLISDFAKWSPFVARDPAMKVTLSQTTTGMGATYEWAIDSALGRGRMEMTCVVALKVFAMRCINSNHRSLQMSPKSL